MHHGPYTLRIGGVVMARGTKGDMDAKAKRHRERQKDLPASRRSSVRVSKTKPGQK